MNTGHNKVLLLVSVILISAFTLAAQQNHFIYLQTENKQPFYLKLDRKILSSSAAGYLIVPKLQDGNYNFTIGFPKNEWPEQYVSYHIDKKDEGFLLKSFGDKGWGLFNLQTMQVVMSGKNPAEILADVKKEAEPVSLPGSKDSSMVKVTEQKAAAKEEVSPVQTEKILQPESPAPVVTPTIAKETDKGKEAPKTALIEITKKEEPLSTLSQIRKLFSVTSSEGSDMVYADIVNGHADTIRLFVPAEKANEIVVTPQPEKKTVAPAAEEAIKKDEPKKDVPVITIINKEEQKEKAAAVKTATPKFIDIELSKERNDSTGLVRPVTEAEKEAKPIQQVKEEIKAGETIRPLITNSDCKNLATDDDFLKLRKKMAAGSKDDEMIDVAKKVFKSRCFTTEQVKNLSVLFLKDEGKYKFFDTVYPFVSDSYNFSSLQSQLTDEYFISRFKAMIRR